MIRTELVRVFKQSIFCVVRNLKENYNILTEDILFCRDTLKVIQPTKLFFIMNTMFVFILLYSLT
jgi:hypothetical protein